MLADAVIVEDTFEGLETLRSLPSLTTHYEELGVEIEGISYESPGNDSYRILGDFNQQNKTNMQSSPYSFSSCFKRENILVHLNEMTNVEKNDYSIPRRRAFSLR